MQNRQTHFKKSKLKPILFLIILLSLGVTFFHFRETIINTIEPRPESHQAQPNQQKIKTTSEPTSPSRSLPKQETDWQVQEQAVQIPILMYHAIHLMGEDERHNANLIVAPDIFESHIRALHEAGYYFLTPEEAYRALTENSLPATKVVWLTFDDSLLDFYTQAYPILVKYNAKATNNVITGFNEEAGYLGHLTLEQMLEMKTKGISFESHTVTHPDLEISSVEQQSFEMDESKSYLDQQLQQNTMTIAYPSGRYDATTLSLTSDYYQLGLTTNEGLASLDNGLLSLNRIRILPTTTAESLIAYLSSSE